MRTRLSRWAATSPLLSHSCHHAVRRYTTWSEVGTLQETLRKALAEGNLGALDQAWRRSKYMFVEGRSHMIDLFHRDLSEYGVSSAKIEKIVDLLRENDSGPRRSLMPTIVLYMVRYLTQENQFEWSESVLRHLNPRLDIDETILNGHNLLATAFLVHATAVKDEELVLRILRNSPSRDNLAFRRVKLRVFLLLGRWGSVREWLQQTKAKPEANWRSEDFAELLSNALRLQHAIRNDRNHDAYQDLYGLTLATMDDMLKGVIGAPGMSRSLLAAEVSRTEHMAMLGRFSDYVLRTTNWSNLDGSSPEAPIPGIGMMSLRAFRTVLKAVIETRGSRAGLELLQRCTDVYPPKDAMRLQNAGQPDELLELANAGRQSDESWKAPIEWSPKHIQRAKLEESIKGLTAPESGLDHILNPRHALLPSVIRDFRMVYRGALRELKWIEPVIRPPTSTPTTISIAGAETGSEELRYSPHPVLEEAPALVEAARKNWLPPAPFPLATDIASTLTWLERNSALRLRTVGSVDHKWNVHFSHLVEENKRVLDDWLRRRKSAEDMLLEQHNRLGISFGLHTGASATSGGAIAMYLQTQETNRYLDAVLDAAGIKGAQPDSSAKTKLGEDAEASQKPVNMKGTDEKKKGSEEQRQGNTPLVV